MELDEFCEQVEQHAIVALDEEDLAMLLEASTTIRADDTCLAGLIRVITLDGHVLVQEQTPEGEVLVRRMGSREEAARFVERRLAAYERMWDGCGYKIDYHQELQDQ